MNSLKPPIYVNHILSSLLAYGYKAYLVGGCVRDCILGRSPHDWDIATSALPQETMAVFPRTVPTGVEHGTVTVVTEKGCSEVTTFRSDGSYTDRRRPDYVNFSCDLTGDLARRDFTMNAMAMDIHGNIIDPFGGITDIGAKLIRCVGDPMQRFSEDSLRMLRALRFSAQLGFDLETETKKALSELAALCSCLSPERVRDEVVKTLRSPRPQLLGDMIGAGLLSPFISGTKTPELGSIASLPLYARIPRLCLILEDAGLITSCRDFLTTLRLDGKTISIAERAVAARRRGGNWKRLLRDFGTEPVRAAYPGSSGLRRILRSGECFELSGLAVTGDDLRALGYTGPGIGKELDQLLDHVIDYPEDNEHNILCKLAERNEQI